jgi:PAS domain S-box-containing protein
MTENLMSTKTLQSQIGSLLKRMTPSNWRRDKPILVQDHTGIDLSQETTASVARKLTNARAQIEAERQSYRNLFGFSQEGYFITDRKGLIREVNAMGCTMLGFPEKDVVGKQLDSYIDVKERPAFLSHIANLIKSGNFHQWESVLLRHPDQKMNVLIKVSPIHDFQDHMVGLNWLIRDITKHQEIEERLKRNTGQLKEAQQLGHVGSWEWDVQQNEVTWSDEMYRIYGLEPQSVKITYEGFLERVHPDDQTHVRSVIANSFKTRQPYSFDHRIVQPTGTIRNLHSQGVLLLDEDGQVVRMLGSGQDVTDQKHVEEELHRLNFELEERVERRTQELSHANERLKRVVVERAHNQEAIQQLNRELDRRVSELQTILNVLPVGVTVAYDPQISYITTNQMGQKILGVSRSENTPAALDQVLPYKALKNGVEINAEERVLNRAIAQSITIRDDEVDLQYEDGSVVNLLTYASPLYDEQEKVRGGVAAFIDITKRKVVEKQLALQYAVARVLAESKEVGEASNKVLEVICRETGWEMGIFWCFDHDANNLYVENIWQKPGLNQNELAEVSRKLFPLPGEGLSGSVYLNNQPLWLVDFSDQPNFPRKEVATNSGFTGVVSFPLRRGEGEVLGVMEFFGRKIQPATPDLMDMFNAFASQIGEFMGRTYAEDLRAMQVKQQAVITQLSQQALLSDDLHTFLAEACNQISEVLSIDFCHVLEVMPEKNQLMFRSAAGWQEEILRSTLDLEPDSQFLYALSDNQPISIHEISSEDRFQVSPFLLKHGIVSGMSVAISGRSQAFGLLEVYNKHRRSFTPDKLHFLQGVSHVLAAAIQHHEVKEALRLSRNQIAVILSGIADGITAQNSEGKLIYANDAAAHIIGYANTDELINAPLESITSMFQMFDESGELLPLNKLPGRLALLGIPSDPMTLRFKVLKSGEERWSVVKSQAVMNDAGKVEMAVNIFHDITDLKRSELAQRLLAATSVILADDLEYETRMANVAKLLVPSLADWCAIDILDENKKLQRLAVVHTDPDMVQWAHEIHKRFPPDPNSPSGAYKVVRTNKAEYQPIIPQEMIDAIPNQEQRELVEKLGLSSYIVVPLSARGHTFGVLSLIWAESGKHYSPDDLTLAEELARRAALAMDNARLYEEAQRLNTELEDRVNRRTIQLERTNIRLVEEVNERKMAEEKFRLLNIELEERVVDRTSELKATNHKLQREVLERELADEALQISLQKTRELYEISQTMGLVNTPDELLMTLLSSSYLKSAIRASVAIFDQVWEEDGVHPSVCTIIFAWNKNPETLLYIGQEMTLVEYGLIEPYSQNETIIIADINHDPRVNEVMCQRLKNIGVVGSVIFPLVAGGEWYGALSLHFDDVIMFNPDDLRHLEGLVDEVAMGIYNFRLLEAEAHARREAEEANNLKLKFLAMVSHELRTPLTSIKGFSTTLLADDVEWDPENQRDFIETISSEADKLTELIEQLLNVSRLEAGTIRISPRRVEWNQIILTSLAQLNTLTADHHLNIEESESVLPILYVDVMRVSQVVTNLVTNAVRYSPKNTTITITAEKLSDKFIKVQVIDEGVGIPPEARGRVFEAFQQLDREKGGTQGAGLGLSICQGLIEAHGGRIWVDDDHVGPGTTMSFTLPVAE